MLTCSELWLLVGIARILAMVWLKRILLPAGGALLLCFTAFKLAFCFLKDTYFDTGVDISFRSFFLLLSYQRRLFIVNNDFFHESLGYLEEVNACCVLNR